MARLDGETALRIAHVLRDKGWIDSDLRMAEVAEELQAGAASWPAHRALGPYFPRGAGRVRVAFLWVNDDAFGPAPPELNLVLRHRGFQINEV